MNVARAELPASRQCDLLSLYERHVAGLSVNSSCRHARLTHIRE